MPHNLDGYGDSDFGVVGSNYVRKKRRVKLPRWYKIKKMNTCVNKVVIEPMKTKLIHEELQENSSYVKHINRR